MAYNITANNANLVGKVVHSSLADDRKLIALVKERKLLYARNNMPVASFFSRVKVLWQEVAAQMNWNVADVRRKWSHIRNSYSRHLRHEMQSARTARGRAVSRWHLADDMDFLKEHMATDVLQIPKAPIASDVMEAISTDHADIFNASAQSIWQIPIQPQIQIDNSDESNNTFTPDENTQYFQFFRSIHNDYQELSIKKQRIFRKQCLLFLHDLLDDEEKIDEPKISNVFVKKEKIEEELVVTS